jgi:uncharacterized protein
MIVKVHEILGTLGAGSSFSFDECVEMEGLELSGNLVVQVELTNAGTRVLAQGTALSAVRMPCSRCGEVFLYSAEVPFQEEFLPPGSPELEYGMFTFVDEEVVLDEMLRQNIISALPMQPVCREDCRGLCASCGLNLDLSACQCPGEALDPRWIPLANLKKAAI